MDALRVENRPIGILVPVAQQRCFSFLVVNWVRLAHTEDLFQSENMGLLQKCGIVTLRNVFLVRVSTASAWTSFLLRLRHKNTPDKTPDFPDRPRIIPV